METTCIGFIGFGLIGGSLARALRKRHPKIRLMAYNYYLNKPNKSLETALEDGTLSSIETDLHQGFPDCHMVFLCAPVLQNIAYLPKLKKILSPTCLITDVGSVKGSIHQAAAECGLESVFIGGHPMAGSEKTGYESASSTLLENAYYILTPTPKIHPAQLQRLEQLVSDVGAIPILLDPETHDNITAAISHVPHIIAASLVNMVKESDDSKETMRSLSAGGFKDITRIASSSPVMWEHICLSNAPSICRFLKQFRESLKKTENDLRNMDSAALHKTFAEAKEYRDSIPSKSAGMIQEIYEVYIDLIDETGAIATIATILASNAISIKNIGILHNREFQDGVLHIELYDSPSKEKTIALLDQYRYTIYDRS